MRGKSKYNNTFESKCRVCLTDGLTMVSLDSSLGDNYYVTIENALELVMGTKVARNKNLPNLVCAMCKGLLSIAYDLKLQYRKSCNTLVDCIENFNIESTALEEGSVKLNKDEKNIPVELISGGNKYDLSDIVIVEEVQTDENNFEGFLKNLGTTISAKIVDKNYKYTRKSEEDSQIILLEKTPHQNIVIEEIVCLKDDVEQYIIDRAKQPYNEPLHIEDVDSSNTYKCDFCQKSYISEGRFLNHLKVCSYHEMNEVDEDTEQSFSCVYCKQRFEQKNEYFLHLREQHEHISGKPYFCAKCDYVTHSSSALAYHVKKHEGKNHQCEICGKKFYRKNILENHKLQHEQKTVVLCPICGKSFHYKSGLVYHMRIHNNERNYVCNVCNKRFYMLNSLKRHTRTHTGIRPYACTYCEKRFFSIGEVRKHEMLHTGLRPFKCKYCNKGFTQNFNLKIHLMSHSGSHKCEICEKSFIELEYLKKHLKEKHNILEEIAD